MAPAYSTDLRASYRSASTCALTRLARSSRSGEVAERQGRSGIVAEVPGKPKHGHRALLDALRPGLPRRVIECSRRPEDRLRGASSSATLAVPGESQMEVFV